MIPVQNIYYMLAYAFQAWVQNMNNIQNRAEEIVLQELIYGEGTV